MVSIAPFRFNITPPLGHALLGGLVPPAIAIDDELEAVGYVLISDQPPMVVCVLDWAGLMNDSHLAFRAALASAAGTTPEQVAVQCVHQHNAPFVCEETRRRAAAHPELEPMFDPAFFSRCLRLAEDAVRSALSTPSVVTHIAHGRARVSQVASNRRVDRDATGRIRTMRGSFCTSPELVALPEGTIDPELQTVAFFSEQKKIVSCHYYASHPMSFYRDGRVTSDFCGLARKRRQTEEPDCTHLYFTGCAGNVAAGKYNDGSASARADLTQRMYDAIRASESSLQPERLQSIQWRTTPLYPTCRPVPTSEELGATAGAADGGRVGKILRAFWQTWYERTHRDDPLILSGLRLNALSILHLPGEPFVEYQLQARHHRGDQPVAVAAYGDGGPWYIPLKDAYPHGGYEVSVAFCEPTIEQHLSGAIDQLLA